VNVQLLARSIGLSSDDNWLRRLRRSPLVNSASKLGLRGLDLFEEQHWVRVGQQLL
jgi:hypothetical protein